MLILLSVSVFFAILWHLMAARFISAALGATITTIAIFQIVGYLRLGYLDPFFEIAIATSGAIALLISVSVGNIASSESISAMARA